MLHTSLISCCHAFRPANAAAAPAPPRRIGNRLGADAGADADAAAAPPPPASPSAAHVEAILARRRPGALNVHLVAHSHDDAGWLKSFDEYYYGAAQATQVGGAYIYRKQVLALLALCV